MDLRKLLGILNETTQNIQQPAEQAVQAMRTGMVKPGYEQAARDYESAFQRGDFNSPYIIGQDPANFGYPEDITTQLTRPVSRPNPVGQPPTQTIGVNGAIDPRYMIQRGGIPASIPDLMPYRKGNSIADLQRRLRF